MAIVQRTVLAKGGLRCAAAVCARVAVYGVPMDACTVRAHTESAGYGVP
jgi:hypothetical protein